MSGFNEAHTLLKQYIDANEFVKGAVENRMIMLTDVGDNSVHKAQKFIKDV